MKNFIIILAITLINTISVQAAEIPRESLPCNATEELIIVTERLVGHIFDEVINGTGYADARAKSNRIIFNAWLDKQTDGYAFGELVNIANSAIWQYKVYNKISFRDLATLKLHQKRFKLAKGEVIFKTKFLYRKRSKF